MWQGMPRTLVDAPPVTAFSTAAAAAAPFAEVLAKAATPVRAVDDESNFNELGLRFEAEDRREEALPVKTSVTVRTAKKAVEEPRASFTPPSDASDACGSAGWNFFWQTRGCGHQAGDDCSQERARI